MRWFNELKISSRLGVSFAAVLALLLHAGVVALHVDLNPGLGVPVQRHTSRAAKDLLAAGPEVIR